jgi:flagellin
VAFTINTNIASLQAQNYLRITQDFQSKTINRVTSGLRIVTSGDDAAGLAIANTYRSDGAVLTQGIRNANDGLSQLQTADGGINNISQLLDRARTLATQSASDAFTGDRTVLNSEFQSVLAEIDRQAQAIGLNQGGTFAKSLSVFIGGGKDSNGVSATVNGSVTLDLSKSTVDAQSLGLKGVQAAGAAGSDIGTGSATSVQNILADATNQASISNNTTTFYFTGPGFADTYGNNVVAVEVNLTGVTDTATLAAAVNQAIANAGNGASQQATAFKNANIKAAINTDANGKQQLTFSSASTAFQVQGGDRVATALLGNFSSGATGRIAYAAAQASSDFAAPAANLTAVKIRILGAGLNGASGDDLSIDIATTDTITSVVSAINAAIAADAQVAATGIQAYANGARIEFRGRAGTSFEVLTAGDRNALGFGSYLSAAGIATTATAFDYNSITAAGASAAATQGVEISINGGATVNLGVLSGSATLADAIDTLNAAFQANAALRAAGIVADNNGGAIRITSAGVNFRLNLYGGTGNAFGFGASPAGSAASSASVASAYAAETTVNSAGAQQSVNAADNDVYRFTGLRNTGDAQTVTLTAVDANGVAHTLNVALTAANANNLDQAVNAINTAILQSNDDTIRQIVALKEVNSANTFEGVRFLSAGGAFKVSLGASAASSISGVNVGLTDGAAFTNGGAVLGSAQFGTGSTADISNVDTAQAAVAALADAVSTLGRAQAVVGRGQNQFNFAINLAQSQVTNLAAAESRIRDADLALESANLTKSQILLQAGIAALSQANSAPQQVLALLRV